jgi:CheY-like chemotaxis protein
VLVVLLEPNATLREAIAEVLTSENYTVEACQSLDEVIARSRGEHEIALVAWQSMERLLADEHRPALLALTKRLRLLLMVPRRWKRLVDQSDLGFVGTLSKPFGADDLLFSIAAAFAAAPRAPQLGRLD